MGADVRYTFRASVPVTLERGRAQVTSISAYFEGALVTISNVEYSLLNPSGTAVVNAAVGAAPGGIAEYQLDGVNDVGPTAPMGTGWQERWGLTMPDGTKRTVRRTAAVARFALNPPVTDDDIIGQYPDILDSLGGYASNLSTWIDEGWNHVVRRLWKNGNFPHILVDASDIYAWAREEATYRMFRALFRSSRGADERWRILWEDHESKAREEAQGCVIRVDRDQDGMADAEGGQNAVAAQAHWNAPATANPRRLSRKFR